MNAPDFETLLREVPCAACKRSRAEHPVRDLRTDGQFCLVFSEDYSAMAQAVREAVIYQSKMESLIQDRLRLSWNEAEDKVKNLQAQWIKTGLERDGLIEERDTLRDERDRLAQEVSRLRTLLRVVHPEAHGHEGWELCGVCAEVSRPQTSARG